MFEYYNRFRTTFRNQITLRIVNLIVTLTWKYLILERLRNELNRGLTQDFERRTSMELTQAVPQTDILGISYNFFVFCFFCKNLNGLSLLPNIGFLKVVWSKVKQNELIYFMIKKRGDTMHYVTIAIWIYFLERLKRKHLNI